MTTAFEITEIEQHTGSHWTVWAGDKCVGDIFKNGNTFWTPNQFEHDSVEAAANRMIRGFNIERGIEV